jgi:hypothetical protein
MDVYICQNNMLKCAKMCWNKLYCTVLYCTVLYYKYHKFYKFKNIRLFHSNNMDLNNILNNMNLNNVNPNGNPEEIANVALTLFARRRYYGDEQVGLVSFEARKARYVEKLTELFEKRHNNFERIFDLARTYTGTHSRRVKKQIEDLEQYEVKLASKVEKYTLKRDRLAQEFSENTVCTNPTFY